MCVFLVAQPNRPPRQDTWGLSPMRAPIEQPAARYHLTDHSCTSTCIQAPMYLSQTPMCLPHQTYSRGVRDKARQGETAERRMQIDALSTVDPLTHCAIQLLRVSRLSRPLHARVTSDPCLLFAQCSCNPVFLSSQHASKRCNHDTNTHLCKLPHKQKTTFSSYHKIEQTFSLPRTLWRPVPKV